MKHPRILFAGTPEFAREALQALVRHDYSPLAVLTQPDRPAGRGKRISESPVKQYAREVGLDILQPSTLRDADVVARLKALQPDIMIVAAYGLLLPQSVLDIPALGCLNIHASLLPRWRGAAPIQAALLAGDAESGVCLMQMEAGLDTGPVYASRATLLSPVETAATLHDRLAVIGGELLVEHLPDVCSGVLSAVKQEHENATYAAKIKTIDALLDWQLPAHELERRVRAYNPVPGAHFFVDELRIKCWQASQVAGADVEPGSVLEQSSERTVIACGSGALSLHELQLPGKRRVNPREFAAQCRLGGMTL